MAYGMPMTPEERMMQLIMQRRNNPYGTPVTMESQVAAGTAQLDPRALEAAGGMAIPASPDLSQNSMSAKQAALQQQARSTAGMESRLASQQAFADSLRGTPGAKLQRVGPSNIAVANPWDGLEVGFNRALGGYMSGKLRDDYTAVDEAKTDQAMGQAEYEAALLAEANAREDEQTGLAQALERELAGNRNATSVQTTQMTVDSQAANREAQNARDNVEMVQLNENGEPIWSSTRMAKPGTEGLLFMDNTPVDESRWIARDDPNLTAATSTESRPTAAQVKSAGEAEAMLTETRSRFANIDRLADFSLGEANQFTGRNLDSWLANIGWGPDGKKGEQFKSIMSAENVGGLLPAIKAAKLTPVSDNDVAIVQRKYVDAMNQPETIGQFYGFTGRQFIQQTVAENLAAGNITPEEAAAFQLDYDKTGGNLALRWGLEPEVLVTGGMDPELVAYLAEKIRREKKGR